MRVAVVTESFLPTINGVTSSVVHTVDQLQRRGHTALVVAPAAHGNPPPPAGVDVVRIPSMSLPGYPGFRLGLPSPALVNALRHFEPDVVHLASPVALGAGAAWAAERAGVPTVAVYQTDLPGYAQRYGVAWAEPVAWRWLHWIHRRAALTLAPSTQTLFALRRRGFPRLALWGRGVDLEGFGPDRRCAALRAHLAPRGEVLVGYVGRLAPEKQCDDLTVLSSIPGVRLVVVGDGPLRQRLHQRLPGAAFPGFLHGDDLARTYASLDLFVHTGTHETFGQTIQEAMASGLPVVAPACGGPLDLVDAGANGLLYPPGDLRALRSLVAELVGNPVARRAMAAAAQRSVATRSWSALTDQLVGHYDSVVGHRRQQEEAA